MSEILIQDWTGKLPLCTGSWQYCYWLWLRKQWGFGEVPTSTRLWSFCMLLWYGTIFLPLVPVIKIFRGERQPEKLVPTEFKPWYENE